MAGNQGNNRIVWQQWQIDFIKENFAKMTAQQLSDAVGIKRTKVREMYYSLGLKKQELEYWTEEQINFLKKNWQTKGDTELAEIFNKKWNKNKGWTKKHIEKKRRYLKLKRSHVQKQAIHLRNVKKGYFAMCPVNAWKTRGVAPEKDKKVWMIGGSPVMVIKVNGHYRHYARFLYEQTFGAIPSGYVVRLKDNDPYNVVPENIVLVSRSENAGLNSRNRYDLEIKRIKVKSKIKYSIHSINKIIEKNEKQIK